MKETVWILELHKIKKSIRESSDNQMSDPKTGFFASNFKIHFRSVDLPVDAMLEEIKTIRT